MKLSRLFFLVIIVALFSACNQTAANKERNIQRSFYYWKSVFNLTPFEEKVLNDLKVKTLYLKFFDVDWNNITGEPIPVAQMRINNEAAGKVSMEMIPVVFITNACILNLDSAGAMALAIKIPKLVNEICNNYGLSFNEIQLDCDWTEQSRRNYFILLREIKRSMPGKNISATIRLYQVKYRNKTGVPPVDRGMLMAYNMGNLKDPASGNSILESSELKKYVSTLSSYPLPLDAALPLFEWKVLFRNNSFTGLIQNLDTRELDNPAVKNTATNRYVFLRDTVLQGYSFLKGDWLRNEQSEHNEILSAEIILSANFSDTSMRLSLFHLDSLILKKYSTHELDEIYNGMH